MRDVVTLTPFPPRPRIVGSTTDPGHHAPWSERGRCTS